MLNELFVFGQINGLYKLEPIIDKPAESDIFKRHTGFLKNRYLLSFLCDTLRVFIFARPDPMDLNRLMEDETDALELERREPANALSTLADALPGLGIVAAVLGIILTMGVISGPRDLIGEKVASSLMGTFLGVLLSYGIFGPLAARLDKMNQNEVHCCRFLRAGIASYTRGCSPIVALEFARRTIPGECAAEFYPVGAGAAKAAFGLADVTRRVVPQPDRSPWPAAPEAKWRQAIPPSERAEQR